MTELLPLPDGTIAEIDDDDFEVEVDGLGTITAHANKADSRLIERFKKPVYRAILRAVSEELQEAENMLWLVLLSRYIDHAEGEALNFLGARVGESRFSQDDPDYRVRIRARVLVNRSRGGMEDLYRIIRALGAVGRIWNTGNASMRVDIRDIPENPAVARQLAGMLGEATSAGVRLHVSVPASAEPFILSSVSEDLGGLLDSVSDPGAGNGTLTAGVMA